MKLPKIIKRFRVDHPDKFRLADIDCADTCGIDANKDEAKKVIADGVAELARQQEMLYAHDHWAVLVIFQAMDAAGKDGVIKHVMSGINPQGCEVHPFKAPTPAELDHDFLWRAAVRLPERGRIGIYNRSYYEEVLVVRVRKEILQGQKLPPELITKDIWKNRFKDIRAFERHLTRNGTKILKFHLRISKEEQARRFLERIDEPGKRWKFSMGDVAERKLWDKYMDAYEDMIRETSIPEAPWFVVPADNKWFARMIVAEVMIDALRGLELAFPVVQGAKLAELKAAEKALRQELPAVRKQRPNPRQQVAKP